MTNPKPWIIAHRGASAEAPDNSLLAFKKAIEMGAHCLEVDVHLSKEGIPICSHDFALGPNCALLSELSVPQIKERTEGTGQVPTLEQLLSLDRCNVQLFIELKSEGCQNIVRLVEAVVDLLAYYTHFSRHQPMIGSFSRSIIRELSSRWPREHLVGIAEFKCDVEAFLPLQPGFIAMDCEMVRPEIVAEICHSGVKVWSWTVDDVAQARQLVGLGVSGIITNNPRLMLESSLV